MYSGCQAFVHSDTAAIYDPVLPHRRYPFSRSTPWSLFPYYYDYDYGAAAANRAKQAASTSSASPASSASQTGSQPQSDSTAPVRSEASRLAPARLKNQLRRDSSARRGQVAQPSVAEAQAAVPQEQSPAATVQPARQNIPYYYAYPYPYSHLYYYPPVGAASGFHAANQVEFPEPINSWDASGIDRARLWSHRARHPRPTCTILGPGGAGSASG